MADMHVLGLDDAKASVPFNFMFRGPPGTGKTETARKLGKIFYDMGFLTTAEVIDCSASDLVGQYVGHTGPRVRAMLDKALGRVLFIDEAYRLADGQFAKEAVDELVDCVTKPRYQRNIIIILAGYMADINRLLDANSGLSSRFTGVVDFEALKPDLCIALLVRCLDEKRKSIAAASLGATGSTNNSNDNIGQTDGTTRSLDLGCLSHPIEPVFMAELETLFRSLSAVPGWASARDVKTIAANVFRRVVAEARPTAMKQIVVRKEAVIGELKTMLRDRQSRVNSSNKNVSSAGHFDQFARLLSQLKTGDSVQPPLSPASTASNVAPRATSSASGTAQPPEARTGASSSPCNAGNQKSRTPPPSSPVLSPVNNDAELSSSDDDSTLLACRRDHGVSDEDWAQLQVDAAAAQERKRELRELRQRVQAAAGAGNNSHTSAKKQDLNGGSSTSSAKDSTRPLSEADAAAREQRRRQEELARRMRAAEEARRAEKRAQAALRLAGRCPVGYAWIRQAGGWRCAGGAHFVSDYEAARLMGGI